jgi:PEP-CTERM motif
MLGFKLAIVTAVGLFGLLGLSAPAFATNISVDNVQLPYSETLNLNGFIDGSSYSDNGQLAGQIVLTVNDISNQFALSVWCVDIFHDIVLGSSGEQYGIGALSTDNGIDASALNITQINDILALATYGNLLMQSAPTNQTSAEVQAAIWTVEYNNDNGNSLSVTGGTFTSTDIINLIATASASGGGGGELIALSGSQAQVFDSVPEPASLSLFGAGLLALCMVYRRRDRLS